MPKRDLSFNDFKKWMDKQGDGSTPGHYLGMKVESKICFKRLLDKIEPQEGELHDIARDFRRHGGKLLQTDDQAFLVECASGKFTISRLFVRHQS